MVKDHTNTFYIACMFLAICLLILFVVVVYLIQESGERRNGEGAKKAQINYEASAIAHEISYMRDERTGLCFAYVHFISSYSFSMTEVPCEKVRDLLPGNQK